ncbi:N-acetylneuraminate lyase [Cryptotermes secundus]|nr:N-acetylneuraminate lyase isoform X2 [Cryptotermes secundus]XP_023710553.1 N-acetylneuraminate lyase isoform X2 [Cryptotermes secundus]XP_023710554.1 N-acetylneuraminate lyase isoform X2 [Cryptotermes secundus]PNF30658.1 N-acetylneuraminate lyase [Cryptotermes secundus]PNF30660.1 N-acetylneuraminate lyase [Cryptotermes secundus]
MAPVLTPYANDRSFSIQLDIIPKYAKYLSSVGINAVLVNGTSGEGMSMTVDERKATTEAWAAAVKETNQILMVQVGGACLKDVQEMAAHAERLGVDGLLCLPELFNKPATVDQLVEYLKYVGQAAPKTPLLYYHIPSYTGVKVSMPQFLATAACNIPTFAGAKYTDSNLEEGTRCLEVKSETLGLFLGCDHVLAGAFALGFDSAVATSLNMLPRANIKILEAMRNNHPSEALQEQRKLSQAINVITRNGGWVSTMKAAMSLMTSIHVGPPRPPLIPLSDEQIGVLKEDLAALELM